MTIQRLVEIFADERKDENVTEEKVTAFVNELETRICTEVFLTHENPPAGVFPFMGMTPPIQPPGNWPPLPVPHPPGYSDEWCFDDIGTIPLLVPPPYDDVYRAYIQWRVDLSHNDTIDAGNSQRVYYQAYQDFAKYWHRTHMPINNTPFAGYKE